ncbi:MAG TPA: hypothetical protein VGO52_21990 [Hyphomonadaceae bacterium]|jgi:hypothetical protein|nr:hypothetical protein [Hyphomonadaceae bacterium]
MEAEDQQQTGWPIDPSPWAWLRWILNQILGDGDYYVALATRGLTRIDASILARTLWSMEAVLRRLLLVAALALKIAPNERAQPKTAAEIQQDETRGSDRSDLNRPFRIFAICRTPPGEPAARTETAAQPAAEAAQPSYLGALPVDPLLRLGEDPPHSPWKGRQAIHSGEDPFNDRTVRPVPILTRRLATVLRIFRDPQAATLRLAHLLARRANAAQHIACAGLPWWYGHTILDRPPGLDEIYLAQDALTAALPFSDTS